MALSWSPKGLPDGLYALQAIGTALDDQTTFAAAPQAFYVDITPPEIVSDLPGEGAVTDARVPFPELRNQRPEYCRRHL